MAGDALLLYDGFPIMSNTPPLLFSINVCVFDCSKLELEKHVDHFRSENEALQLQVVF